MPLELPRDRYPYYAVRPCVYVITHSPTGRHYVGATVWPRMRLTEHRHSLQGGAHHSRTLQAAFDQDGAGAFVARVVEVVVDPFDLAEREEWWACALDARSPERGFNGRPPRPFLAPRTLSRVQATVARLAYRSGRMSVDELARAYGITRRKMSQVLLITWRHGGLP